MTYYLARMKVLGIKNIDKEIQLDFTDKTIKSKCSMNQSNIKSIYGTNGSGKSAIINAVEIYKNLIFRNNYLQDSQTTIFLNEIVNKKLGQLELEMTIEVLGRENLIIAILNHKIILQRTIYGDFQIIQDKLEKLQGQTLDTAKKIVLYQAEQGVLQTSENEDIEKIRSLTANLLKKRAIPEILASTMTENDNQFEITKNLCSILSVAFFAMNLHVELTDSDQHSIWMIQNQKFTALEYQIQDSCCELNLKNKVSVTPEVDSLIPAERAIYEKQIKKLAEFIKIFKPDLRNIECEYKETKDVIFSTKYLVYDDYRIASEFESSGVKKLIQLYDSFKKFMNGEIVFIDELDANLHDVYLCKLLEYFSVYGRGQLCFTTHNLAPMEILSKRKHSIDFLSDHSQITSWKKKGNYSVVNMYRSGMIDNSPFNIDAFDFIGIFEDEAE